MSNSLAKAMKHYYTNDGFDMTSYKYFLKIRNANGKIVVIGIDSENEAVISGDVIAAQFVIPSVQKSKGRITFTKQYVSDQYGPDFDIISSAEDAMEGLPATETREMALMRTT